jgi:hypothetical protein
LLARTARAPRARPDGCEVLQIQRRALPDGHRLIAVSAAGLGDVELRAREWQVAESAPRDAFDLATRFDPPDDDLSARGSG